MADFPSFKDVGGVPIVYVRSVKVDELPEPMREEAEGLETVYAVANSDGQVLALVDDRDRAFMLARMNELQPVSVH